MLHLPLSCKEGYSRYKSKRKLCFDHEENLFQATSEESLWGERQRWWGGAAVGILYMLLLPSSHLALGKPLDETHKTAASGY